MGKVYSPPKELDRLPNFSSDWKEYEKECDKWLSDLKEWCKRNGDGEERGKIVRTVVADGYVEYMVLSIKPVKLIHIPLGDAWHFQWAHRWTAKDIKEMIKREEKLETLFSRKE